MEIMFQGTEGKEVLIQLSFPTFQVKASAFVPCIPEEPIANNIHAHFSPSAAVDQAL